MGNLQKFREYHYDATVKVSENTRTLALAAIAIVWLFKIQSGEQYLVPMEMKWPLYLAILALAFDFFQHFIRSIIWHYLFRKEEKKMDERKITEKTELYVSHWFNDIVYFFYYTKVVFLTIAYIKFIVCFPKMVGWWV
jgi:hypothetical protein